jgi:O-antigen/teichoic acid export membrane protein
MSRPPPSPVRQLVGGGAFVLGADALQLPASLVLGVYLARKLGAEGLGLYLLATSLVGWLELVVSSLFSRATVHLVGESHDWQPVASLVLRWHLFVSLAFFAALWVAVAPFTEPFDQEALAGCVLLLSFEIPLFGLARSHSHLLIGLGRYREKAWTAAARWSSRLVLGVLLVELGLGVRGAILGAVGSTAVELLVARWFVRPRFGVPSPPGLRRRLFDYSWPLFLHGIALQLFHRMGLLLLVPLGSTVAAAGVYGAADSLLRLRRTLGQSLTPLLLSTLSRMQRDDQHGDARRLSRNALRFVLLTVPVVATIAGASPAIMAWLFGPAFRAGGPVLAVLMASAPPFLVLSLATAVLTSRGRPRVPVLLTSPMVPIALAGYWFAVPRWDLLGAAWVTTLTIAGSALACLVVLQRHVGIATPVATAARALATGALAFFAARSLPAGGWWLCLELPAIALASVGLFAALGEASAEERAWLRREVGARLASQRSPGL